MKKALGWMVISLLYCITTLSCRYKADKVNPHFESARQYRYKFFSSEEECRRITGQNNTRACSETIYFDTKGKVSALLGRSDLIIAGKYQIEEDNIIVTLQDGPIKTLKITFETVSSTELLRGDNSTIWTAY
ncbi:hypothetical protein [Spirosoma utsteinense]|uniref:Lipocalin-like domain-containing protein n=1 Tax=Spirosoma utsteinense TaxID=2585773 RepID=A0ABR6WFS5_9BACT|nr:hypothetical protein [Spirosoma utsteinense]MBC3789475.1 hypothetical protein [Spirosoma utsteinense]MBC3795381.1 hypothetical protein [Spirosoma utsteinense]